MKMCISIIHLGRYKIDMLDDDNQITRGWDCGSAGIVLAISEWIFRDEAIQYQRDQRKSSDQLGDEATKKIMADPVLNPKGYLYTPHSCPDHIASDDDPKTCKRCGLHISELI